MWGGWTSSHHTPRPVYYAVGGRSNPDYFARQADRLSTVFADFTVEVYDERHHFDPHTEPSPNGWLPR